MNSFIFANNINAELAGGISSTETTLTLNSTQNLPTSIPSGSVMALTLCNATPTTAPTVFEIVYVTAISGATLTVIRAQEGTAAQVWLTGNAAFSGPTAGQMASFIQGASSGVTPGTYGTSTSVSTITINANGIITDALDTTIAFPITSFNGRGDAVTLTTGDVTTALGFSPLGAAIAANTLLGNPTGASTAPTTITLANGLQFASGALGLGAITPSSVAATGSISGTTGSFSGAVTLSGATPFIFGALSGTATTFWQAAASGDNVATITRVATDDYALNWNGTISTSTIALSNATLFQLTGMGASGTGFWQGFGGSGDNILTMTRAGSSNYNWTVNGTINISSDERLKHDLEEAAPLPVHDAWWGSYVRNGANDEAVEWGSTAQSIRRFHPHHVHPSGVAREDGTPELSVDFTKVALEQGIWCGRAIDRELRPRVADLIARIEALEARA